MSDKNYLIGKVGWLAARKSGGVSGSFCQYGMWGMARICGLSFRRGESRDQLAQADGRAEKD